MLISTPIRESRMGESSKNLKCECHIIQQYQYSVEEIFKLKILKKKDR
jgi:hypothetical protein